MLCICNVDINPTKLKVHEFFKSDTRYMSDYHTFNLVDPEFDFDDFFIEKTTEKLNKMFLDGSYNPYWKLSVVLKCSIHKKYLACYFLYHDIMMNGLSNIKITDMNKIQHYDPTVDDVRWIYDKIQVDKDEDVYGKLVSNKKIDGENVITKYTLRY